MQPPPGKPRVPPPPPPGSGFPPPPRSVPSQPPPAGRIPAYGSAPVPGPAAPPPAAPTAAPAPWNQPAVAPELAMRAMSMPRRPRSGRGFLRFFAVSCITTAWITLVLSVILGLLSFGAGGTVKAWASMAQSYSASPGLGGGGLGSGGLGGGGLDSDGLGSGGLGGGGLGGGGVTPGGANQQIMTGLLGGMVERFAWLCYLGGFLNILGGICGWIFFVGLGKLTYGYLDLEEQAERDHEAVQILLASAGSR